VSGLNSLDEDSGVKSKFVKEGESGIKNKSIIVTQGSNCKFFYFVSKTISEEKLHRNATQDILLGLFGHCHFQPS
jgi:hypothetical protein